MTSEIKQLTRNATRMTFDARKNMNLISLQDIVFMLLSGKQLECKIFPLWPQERPAFVALKKTTLEIVCCQGKTSNAGLAPSTQPTHASFLTECKLIIIKVT